MHNLDTHATIQPATSPGVLVEVRGPSGRLYGRLDPQTLILEVKRKNEAPERIDLRKLLTQPDTQFL